MTGVKAKPKKLFEPITLEQNKRLHAVAQQMRFSDERLYAMVKELIGMPSISALSKQEAAFIVDRMTGFTRLLRPAPPRSEDQISGDASNLPYLGHVRAIRRMAATLAWEKQHLKNWLKKYIHVRTIRELDRQTARSAFLGMKNILERAQSPR